MLGTEYTAVYAKVKKWSSGLVKADEWAEILRLSADEAVREAAGRNIKTAQAADNIEAVEALLKEESYLYTLSAMRYLSPAMHRFIDAWSRFYEIENIKTITRCLLNQKPISGLYNISVKSRFRRESVKDIHSLDEFQDFLSGTDYYRLAADTFPRIKEEQKTFFFEINLDNFFARSLKNQFDRLAGHDRSDARQTIMLYMDIQRIVWIYRARFHYEMSPSDTIAVLPNLTGLLNRKIYDALIASDSTETFIGILDKAGYLDSIRDNGFEQRLYRKLFTRMKRIRSGLPFRAGILLEFLIRHELNVKNWIMVLELKKRGMDTARIKSRLYPS